MNSGIIWIIAAFVGFIVWWPIGVAFLVTIFATAVSQQLTGYRHPQQSIHIGEVTPFDRYKNETLRRIEADQAEVRAITDRLRNAKTRGEFDRLMGGQRKLGGY